MKRTSLIFALVGIMVMMLTACGSNKANSAQAELTKQRVQQLVGSREFTIMVDNAGRGVILKRDHMVCNMTYEGDGTEVAYGNSFKSLNFNGPVSDYNVTYPKDKKADITFTVNTNDDEFKFHIEVFYNGKAFIDVNPRGRSAFHHSGVLVM